MKPFLVIICLLFFTSCSPSDGTEENQDADNVQNSISTDITEFIVDYNLQLNINEVDYKGQNLMVEYAVIDSLRSFEYDEFYLGLLCYDLFQSYDEITSIQMAIVLPQITKDPLKLIIDHPNKAGIEKKFTPALLEFSRAELKGISPTDGFAITNQYKTVIKDWHQELDKNFFFMLNSYLNDCDTPPKESVSKQALTLTGFYLRKYEFFHESEIVAGIMEHCGISSEVWDK